MKYTGALPRLPPSRHLRHFRPKKTALLSLSPSALPLWDYPLAAGAAMPSFHSPSRGRAAGAGGRGEERGTWESGSGGRLGER